MWSRDLHSWYSFKININSKYITSLSKITRQLFKHSAPILIFNSYFFIQYLTNSIDMDKQYLLRKLFWLLTALSRSCFYIFLEIGKVIINRLKLEMEFMIRRGIKRYFNWEVAHLYYSIPQDVWFPLLVDWQLRDTMRLSFVILNLSKIYKREAEETRQTFKLISKK